ncbi:hypothetical protein JCM16303_004707 [Sporobolomyces ruberrimus]
MHFSLFLISIFLLFTSSSVMAGFFSSDIDDDDGFSTSSPFEADTFGGGIGGTGFGGESDGRLISEWPHGEGIKNDGKYHVKSWSASSSKGYPNSNKNKFKAKKVLNDQKKWEGKNKEGGIRGGGGGGDDEPFGKQFDEYLSID